MNGTCAKCGGTLYKGNIKVIRPRGKKRPFRVCRRCPEPKGLPTMPQEAVEQLVPQPKKFAAPGDKARVHSWKGDTAGDGLQRPQDTTGGPVTWEGVCDFGTPPRYRYFMTQDQAAHVRERLAKTILLPGFGVGFEVIPVPEDQVEADPEVFADLVEVTVEWK